MLFADNEPCHYGIIALGISLLFQESDSKHIVTDVE